MFYKPVVDLRVYRFSVVFCCTRDREDYKEETMSYKTITINEIQVIGKIWLSDWSNPDSEEVWCDCM